MNYHHLSIEERSCIRKYYVDGLSYREIGIVKKTAHPTCPVMPPVLVLTATVSA